MAVLIAEKVVPQQGASDHSEQLQTNVNSSNISAIQMLTSRLYSLRSSILCPEDLKARAPNSGEDSGVYVAQEDFPIFSE